MDGGLLDTGVPQLSPQQQQQQQKMILDYLASLNGGPVTPATTGEVDMTQRALQDMMTSSQLMDMFNNVSVGPPEEIFASPMNPALMSHPPPQPQQPFPAMSMPPMMNSTFHREFLKQIANVQKEQGNGLTMQLPGKRPVGRPPLNGAPRTQAKGSGRESSGSPRFACDYCQKTFASRYYLATHIQVHLSQLSPEERKEQMRMISSPEQLRLLERAEERQRYMQGQKPAASQPMPVAPSQLPKEMGMVPRFKCVKCVASFNEADEYKQHLAMHVGDKPVFHCHQCNKTYKYEGAYQSHRCMDKNVVDPSDLSNGFVPDLKRLPAGFVSQGSVPHQMDLQQPRLLANDGNNNHNNSLSGSNNASVQKCALCPGAFASAIALNEHIRVHHKLATGRSLPCQHCDQQFLTIADLAQHQEQSHVGMEASGDLICVVCNSAFRNVAPYFKHIRSHNNVYPFAGQDTTYFDDGAIDQDELDCNAEEESDLTKFFAEEAPNCAWNFTCDACGGKFMREKVYQYHLLLHRGERPYSCGECARAFKSRPVLTLHELCHRSAEERSQGALPNGNGHMAVAAAPVLASDSLPNGMTYQCSICEKVYDNKTALREHEVQHSVEGEYTCKVCGKKFRSLIGLKIHSNKHQNDLIQQHLSGAAMHLDRNGVNGAIGEKNLLYYEEVDGVDKERPYICRVCDKRFKTKHALPYHMLLHTGETPFGCDFCGKGFRALISLKLHAKKHEEKGYNPSFDHLELVQRQYQQAILMLGETRSVAQGKPPALTEVIPFAKAVAMAPHVNGPMVMGRRSGMGMEGDSYGEHPPRVNGGHVEADAEDQGEEVEPNIHDFCAVEMMMEPEVEINESHGEETEGDGGESQNGHNGHQEEDMNEVHMDVSQYAHLLPDEGEDGEPMMLKNEDKSDFEFDDNGPEDEVDDEDGNEAGLDHSQLQQNGEENVTKFNTELMLEKAMQPQPLAIDSILKYECPICFKRFKNRLSLPYHMMTHERGDPVSCNYCNRKFVSKFKLRRHLRMKHNVVDPSLGDDENEEPKPPVSRFGKFKFACPTCNRKFKSKFTLKLHMKHHHFLRANPGRPPRMGLPQEETVMSVPSFMNGDNVAMLQSLMNGQASEESSQREASHDQPASSEDAQFDCDQCDKKFVTFPEYKLHMKFHLEEVANAASVAVNRSVSPEAKARPQAMQNIYRLSKEYEHLKMKDGRYQCNICHKIFKCRQSLPYHMNLHKKNSIFRCLICKTGFRNLHSFKIHNRVYHKDRLDANGQLNMTDVSVKQELDTSVDQEQQDPSLENSRNGVHEENTNGSIKQENVDGMDLSAILNQSMGDQMTNNPFGLFNPTLLQLQQFQMLQNMQQPVPGTSGSTTGSEDGHQKPAGIITGQEPEMRPIELETGERGYLCSLCQKVCRSKQASIYHRMIHTGEKPYKCNICDKRCRSQANLELHKKMHVNEGENGTGRRRSRQRESMDGMAMEGGDNTGLGVLSMMMQMTGSDPSVDTTMQKWRAYADMKLLRCIQCDYKFKSVQALTYHCMIHTNEKPYKCLICNNSFRSKTNLNLHEKSHQRALEGNGGVGAMGSSGTGGSFQQGYDDNMEITLETLQNCPEIANGFLNQSMHGPGAAASGRSASPASCYCLVCEKTFRTEGYVRHHQLLVHTVRSDVNVYELPTLIASQDGYMYKCDICQNCFRTKQYYYFHVSTHHPEAATARKAPRSSNSATTEQE